MKRSMNRQKESPTDLHSTAGVSRRNWRQGHVLLMGQQMMLSWFTEHPSGVRTGKRNARGVTCRSSSGMRARRAL